MQRIWFQNRFIGLILTCLGLTLSASVLTLTQSAAEAADKQSEGHPGQQAFVNKNASQLGMDQASLDELIASAVYKQSIIDAITRPAESKPWKDYRKIFLTPTRIRQGVQFWQENQELVAQVAATYAVPPEVFLAIIGVETSYGRNTGSYRVLDALATLGFYYERRGEFFQKELAEFVKLTSEEAISVDEATGSYAGAMGLGQFIPSSYRAYTVDFDEDGRRDLWKSLPDAVASVANYLHVHGWQPGQATALQVEVDDPAAVADIIGDITPELTAAELRQRGVNIPSSIADDGKVSLFEMQADSGTQYWLGLKNFYVITRYNRSPLYALAVTQLSQELRKNYQNN